MVPMRKQENETELVQELRLVPDVRVKINEPLAPYTSMKIGGPADYFLEVGSRAALIETLRLLNRHGIPSCLLGKGSNVLVSDLGVRGGVLRLTGEFGRIEWREAGEKVLVHVGAAYPVTQLVRQAARKGYSGLEFAEGIPGSVGGALVMNAGAYGSEMEKIVNRVEGVTDKGKAVSFSRDEMAFTYRDSHLPQGTIVTAVGMRLEKGAVEEAGTRVRELVGRRKRSHITTGPVQGEATIPAIIPKRNIPPRLPRLP